MEKLHKFKMLGLSDDTLLALEKKGFEEPTAIQEKTIPLMLKSESHIIGQAQTGTGKTAAFGLPLIDRLEENQDFVQALVLVPTRELALQVSEEIMSLKGSKRLYISAVYGGQSFHEQLRRLRKGVDIVVGTPGRILDHLERESLDIRNIKYLILDEADEMLNMGFLEDVEKIMNFSNEEKRILLFSATMPDRIKHLARNYMGNYELIKIENKQLTVELTEQIYFEVNSSDKFEALCRIIDIEVDFYGLIFCRTKLDVDELTSRLQKRGYDVDGIHGDITQNMREKVLERFKAKTINILVATDVAARGIDINNLTHVINFSLPQDPESYVHRIGRTGRAGKEGTAITFVTPDEYRKLIFIQRIAKTTIKREKVPGIQEVIEVKRSRIKETVARMINNDENVEMLSFAYDLAEQHGAEAVSAALLNIAFGNDLDESRYVEIKDINRGGGGDRFVDGSSGKTRLFVALGKEDGYNPKKLIDLISEKCGIDERRIQGLTMFDRFSFVNVPFEDAEIIIEQFRAKNKGERTIIRKADDRSDKRSDSSDNRRSGSSDGRRSGGSSEGRSGSGDRSRRSSGDKSDKPKSDKPKSERWEKRPRRSDDSKPAGQAERKKSDDSKPPVKDKPARSKKSS